MADGVLGREPWLNAQLAGKFLHILKFATTIVYSTLLQ